MLFKLLFVIMEQLPDFHQRRKDVARYRPLRRKNAQNSSAAQKWLKIGSEVSWKMPDDRISLFLLVSNPFE